jgi:spoIIIJ-associated protein
MSSQLLSSIMSPKNTHKKRGFQMTADFEFEGRDVEKAAKTASERLGISLENLKYDIVSYGSTGIFGLVGARKAKIRVLNKVLSASKKGGENDDRGAASGEVAPADKRLVEKDDPSPQMFEEALHVGHFGLQKILGFIAEDASVLAGLDGDRLVYEISGGNPAALIGKRGQTLDALQYLVERMVNAKSEARFRVHIDVEGYLKNRAEKLSKLAAEIAEKVSKNRKPATLGQLNSHDRRIVHLALKEEERVRTQSLGSGYYRKLVIYPKKETSPEAPGRQPA